jgi:hypothetical protein
MMALPGRQALRDSMLRIAVLANPWIWVGVAVILLLRLLFIHLPGLHQLCHSAP